MMFRIVRIALAAAAVLAASTPTSAPAQVLAKGGCAPNALRYIVSATFQFTTSANYVNISETKLTFVQGGSKPDCVTVAFTAEAAVDPNKWMFVQAVLDGSVVCEPGDQTFSYSQPIANDRAMNFICPNVTPGNHAIQLKMRSDGSATVAVAKRTTIVHYLQ